MGGSVIGIISTKQDVEQFLSELKGLLNSPTFNVDEDLDILLKKKNEQCSDPFTTFNTLQTLEFDRYDVRDQLAKLDVTNYVETLVDIKGVDLPNFYVFGITIQEKEIYIKVKIRDKNNCKVFCISFHFAKFPLSNKKPYK